MKPAQTTINHWLKLIILFGLYINAIHASSRKSSTSTSVLNNFLVCQSDDRPDHDVKMWCKTSEKSGKETQTQFVDCVNACPDAQAWVHPAHDSVVVGVEPYGASAFNHLCFLNCFFSQEMAIYRRVPASNDNLFGFLEDAVTYAHYEHRAHVNALNKEKKTNIVKCLQQDSALTISHSPILPYMLMVSSSQNNISANTRFRQCFFQEETAVAARHVEQVGLLSYLERDKFPGYEVGPVAQMKAHAM